MAGLRSILLTKMWNLFLSSPSGRRVAMDLERALRQRLRTQSYCAVSENSATSRRHSEGHTVRQPRASRGAPPGVEELRPVSPEDWSAIETLFGNKGACGGCWCMYWRVERGGRTWDEMRGALARAAFRQFVETSKVRAILAFAEGAPVAWLCLGPYEDFPRLRTVRALLRERPSRVWSVVCFYILPRFRRHGLGTSLLRASVELARSEGARILEGYPVPARGSMPGAFVWTGVPPMFKQVGFEPLPNPTGGRQIWVHNLNQSPGSSGYSVARNGVSAFNAAAFGHNAGDVRPEGDSEKRS
jgi:GNAT superfamily N-acetyltransferase